MTVALLVGVTLSPALAPVARADDPAWLQLINSIRTADGLQPVSVDDAWTAGIVAHLRYLRLTPAEYFTGIFASVHYENPQSPYYTPEGAAAGQSSDLLEGGAASDVAAIEIWLAAPFHAIGMLRPGLTRVAFARDPVTGAAGLDVLQGLLPATPAAPIEFPAPGTTTDRAVFGGEFPSPLPTCGYSSAGLPIVVLLPTAPTNGLTADLTGPDGSTVTAPGNDLCLVTAANYTSSDPIYGPTGEAILQGDHAVLIIPRHGLTSGRYAVSLRRPGQADVSWSFTSDPPAAQVTFDAWHIACSGSQTRVVHINGFVVDDWSAVGGVDRRVSATIGSTTLTGWTLHADGLWYGVGGILQASTSLPAGTATLRVTIEDPATSQPVATATTRLAGCAAVPTGLLISAGRSVRYGSGTRITGKLWRLSAGTPVVGVVVSLYARPVGTTTWTAVHTAKTNAAGSVTFTQSAATNTEYQLRFGGATTTAPAASAIRLVTVLPVVSATLSASTVSLGQPATVTGFVSPVAPGGTVKLQEHGATGWVTIAYASLSETSSYTFPLPTAVHGSFQFRVYRAADGTHGTATSAVAQLSVN